MTAKNIAPLVLAAGQSSRFGSDKLLHTISHQGDEKPLILHSLSPWVKVFPVVNVVVREDNEALLQLLTGCDISGRLRLIITANAHKGMSQSFIAGVKAHEQADGWLVGLGDMPYLGSRVIAASLAALEAGAQITLPEFMGRRGHPVGFAARFLPQLLALKADTGAKGIIQSHKKLVYPIQADNEGIFRDIDCPEDLQQLDN